MDFSRLQRGEIVAVVGGLALLIGVFVKWYEAVSPLVDFDGDGRKEGIATYTGWDAHAMMRYLLVAGAIAPLILAYIIVRDHQLSWPRGQLTSLVAITALGLLFYNAIIDRPGEPSAQIELEWGWYVAFGGAILMLVGSVMRQQESEMKRKPPGVI